MHRKQLLIALCIVSSSPLLAAADKHHACADLVEPLQRLHCYDQAFPPSQKVIDAVLNRKEQQFGLAEQTTLSKLKEDQGASDQISSRIVSVDDDQHGQRLVLLANGQRWQVDGSRGTLDEGDLLTIRNASLGSHMAITPSGVRLRAYRLQ